MSDDWSPETCACRWGEQPCWMCLPVLDARHAARQKTRPKREWGKAPAHVRRTPSGCWHWECRLCPVWVQRTRCATGLDEAVTGLAGHQEAEHVDALFRGDRGGLLGMAMDRTSERSGA